MNLRFPNPLRIPLVLLGLVLAIQPPTFAKEQAQPQIRVILWFDTEDYLSPADDDATKRLCELLSSRGIRATFKIVGEKARVLQRRGRIDVIRALKRHDIGYHTDFHSVHPTPTEYLADCGWLEGIDEFVRREGPGAADVRRIFGLQTLACYGQPGSSWAPQAIAALPAIGVAPHGVPCYVDEGTHVGFNGEPFWYAGALMVYHLSPNYTRMELHDPDAVEPAKKEVAAIAARLRAQGGGLISIFYHPCEWVHREFWDGVNFRRGANPPREQWQPPPQRSAEETEAAFSRFAEYIDHIRSLPGVRWVTASELPSLYPDRLRTEGAPESDMLELAKRIVSSSTASSSVDLEPLGPRIYSVADQFEILATVIGNRLADRQTRFPLKIRGLMGPDAAPPNTRTPSEISWFAFRDAARDVARFTSAEHRVPARVFIGAESVAPADFLLAMAKVWVRWSESGSPPTNQRILFDHPLTIAAEKYVAQDSAGLFGDWVIHKENFRAPELMRLARLQAWTLKPASRKME